MTASNPCASPPSFLRGSIVAIVTPMLDDGEVDYKAFARLIDFHVDAGTDAIVAVGTTGESATLSHAENTEVIRFAVECAAGRVPIIGGTGSNSTSEAIELTLAAGAAGATACLLVTPYYNRPTQRGLLAHFEAIAAATPDMPLCLYNVPARTGCDMLAETTAQLASVANILGVKEAAGTMERVHDLLRLCPSDFAVLSGEDFMSCDAMLAGAHGVISVTANVAPAQMHEMCKAALAGDAAAARELDAGLQPLHKTLFCESSPTPSKWALQHMGLIGGGIRLPLVNLSPHLESEVLAAMDSAESLLATA